MRFEHHGITYEGIVQWIEDNDSPLSQETRHPPGCVSLMLSTGQTMNDLPKTTPPVETSFRPATSGAPERVPSGVRCPRP